MVYIAQQSFGFGEVDPNIRAQYESLMYQKGCQTFDNAMLSETGSAKKRWGSVYSSTITNGDKAFEFIDGYGDRYLIIGNSTGYTIEVNGTEIASFTSSGPPTDVTSTGSEFYAIVPDGLFLHRTLTSRDGTSYVCSRSKVDPAATLISTTPPTTFTVVQAVNDGNSTESITLATKPVTPTLVTASSGWFSVDDVGDLYKLGETKSRDTISTTGPRWALVSRVVSPTSAYMATTDQLNLQQSSTPISAGVLTIPGHGIPSVTYTSQFPTAKWYRGNVDANYYTNEPPDGKTVLLERLTDDTFQIHTTGNSGPSLISNTSGQDRSTYLLKLGGDVFTNTPGMEGHVNLPDFPDAVTTASNDWVGPYRNWTPLSNAVYTNFDYGGAGVTKPSGVYQDVSPWPAWAQGATLKWDNDGVGSWGMNTDNVHQQLVSQGVVLKAVHYINSGIHATSYFVATWKPFMGDDGAINTASPRLTHICGPALAASRLSTTVPANAETLIWYIASSEDQTSTAIKMADGLPAPKNGWNPSLLVRTVDSNPDGASSGVTYPVALVGSSSRTGTYTSYQSSFATNDYITDTTTTANCVNRYSVLVGEIAPAESSQVFRLGYWEKNFDTNYSSGKTEAGEGPVANWEVTGAAFSPAASPNATFTNTSLVRSSVAAYHQSRIILSGFAPADFPTEDTGGLRDLIESQFLGTTVISSKSGSPSDFTTGEAEDDGLSFQITAKQGGKIVWLKSHMNALFIGTGEEEFVIEDAPLIPAQINVSSQSEYGSSSGTHAALFGNNVVFVQKDGRTIRAMGYEERRRRFESTDLLQYAKHITKNEKITRIAVVGTANQYLFILTDAGKVWCLGLNPQNEVFGWSQWKSDYYTYSDILGTNDGSGNPALWARVLLTGATTASKGVYITSDPIYSNRRMDLIEEHTGGDIVNTGSLAGVVNISADLLGKEVSYILLVGGVELYYGNATVITTTGGVPTTAIYFGGEEFGTVLGTTPTKVYIGLPYTFSLVPNIPELMLPGKGSTSGRNKNISRIRAYLNAARGGVVEGYSILPATAGLSLVPDSPGFYSVSVIGEYGPQPEISINQSVPYEFEVSGYNAEYDFGD